MAQHERFLSEMRLRRRADFQKAYQRRCVASDGLLLVFANLNGLDTPRLGLSVSRKVGGAVVRNRWKRRIREAFRISRTELPNGIDLVVIPKAAGEPEFSKLRESLIGLARRLAQKLSRAAP